MKIQNANDYHIIRSETYLQTLKPATTVSTTADIASNWDLKATIYSTTARKNPKWKPFEPKKPNLQRNFVAAPNKRDEEFMTKEEIMAKIEMAYEMGKGAQEANTTANRTEMSNFMRSLSTPATTNTQEYSRKVTLFRNLATNQ